MCRFTFADDADAEAELMLLSRLLLRVIRLLSKLPLPTTVSELFVLVALVSDVWEWGSPGLIVETWCRLAGLGFSI